MQRACVRSHPPMHPHPCLPACLQDTSLQQQFQALTGPNAGTLPQGPDPKWRYLWRVGDRPEATQYQELNAEPVMPQVSQ